MPPEPKVTDRPNMFDRIFRIRLRAIMAYIINGKTFGEVETHACVMEF